MSGTRLLPTPSYLDLLDTAYALGRVDGLLAADFEPLEGAGPSSVQERLGHSSAVTTLNTYSHLWPDSDDRTRAAVDDVLRTAADQVRTSSGAAE